MVTGTGKVEREHRAGAFNPGVFCVRNNLNAERCPGHAREKLFHHLVLKGHDFSRAVTEAGKSRALAPERVTSGRQRAVIKQVLRGAITGMERLKGARMLRQ